jgi:UDP-glucose 4-epimerase
MRQRNSLAVVTGGLGYIGGHVVDELLLRGWRVRVLDNLYRSSPATVARVQALPGVEVVEGDIRYARTVDLACAGAEAVVHLAAVCMNKSIADPLESLDVNLMGTQNVLDAAARNGVRRVVYASSASVYGDPVELPMTEDGPVSPITPYCTAKLAGEHLLEFHGRRQGLTWLALRFFNVYGPGQPTDAYYTSVVVRFLERVMAGEAPEIDGHGDQSMDFVHVADVARAVGLALDSEATGHALNVGTGRQTSVADLAHLLVKLTGATVTPVFRPREVLVSHREASVDLVREVLGWEPEVPLEEGLATLVDWCRDRSAAGARRL